MVGAALVALVVADRRGRGRSSRRSRRPRSSPPVRPALGISPLGGDALGARRASSRRSRAAGCSCSWQLPRRRSASASVLPPASSAAYLRGVADRLVMRAADVILAFPQLVFALLLISIVGPRPGCDRARGRTLPRPQVARVVRAAALEVTQSDYVRAASWSGSRAAGSCPRRSCPT